MSFFQVGAVLAAAFVLGAILTKLLIPCLIKMHTGQNIREEGPQSHQTKAGTPSMGGIAIIAATIAVFAAALGIKGYLGAETLIIAASFVVFGGLGFWDDYTKVIKKQNLGLRAWQKLAAQIIIGVIIAFYMANYSILGTVVFIPFVNAYIDFGIWYIPFIAFVVVAMTNSVNLTDGLDGLAGGVTAFVSLFFAIAGMIYNYATASYFCAALCGACAGFLIYNKNPARVFMGDTGSLALGGGLAAAAILMNMTLLLPIVGLIYVLEALSVIMQVGSFKTRGKRVFKMAPLHHHFELCGMKETRVVAMFWIVAILCCAVGFVAF